MIIVTVIIVALGCLVSKHTGMSGFLVWPGVTAVVVLLGLSVLSLDKVALGVPVKGESLSNRLGVVFTMALFAEVVYTAYWLGEKLFTWIAAQGYA